MIQKRRRATGKTRSKRAVIDGEINESKRRRRWRLLAIVGIPHVARTLHIRRLPALYIVVLLDVRCSGGRQIVRVGMGVEVRRHFGLRHVVVVHRGSPFGRQDERPRVAWCTGHGGVHAARRRYGWSHRRRIAVHRDLHGAVLLVCWRRRRIRRRHGVLLRGRGRSKRIRW